MFETPRDAIGHAVLLGWLPIRRPSGLRAQAVTLLRRAARASEDAPPGRDFAFRTHLRRHHAWIAADAVVVEVDRLLPRLPCLRVAVLTGDLPKREWDRSTRTALLDRLADGIAASGRAPGRPEGMDALAERCAAACLHLAPGGTLEISAGFLGNPGAARIVRGPAVPDGVASAAAACPPGLRVSVEYDVGRRDPMKTIRIGRVVAGASIPSDPVAAMRRMAGLAAGST